MSDAVIVAGVRTPFVRARGLFKKFPPSTLASLAIRQVLLRTQVEPKQIGEHVLGIVSAPAEGSNVAREALFDSNTDPSIPCTTVNRYCASSAEAVNIIVAKLMNQQIEFGLASGVESISSVVAHFTSEATDFFQSLTTAKTFKEQLKIAKNFRPSFFIPHAPGIQEPSLGLTMGQSADLMAREFKIKRADQDQFALRSHQRANAAWEKGFYDTHVIAVNTPEGNFVQKDTDIRKDTSVQKLSALKPIFYQDGTITAGNASPLTDGASACLLTTELKAKSMQLPILGKIRAISTAAVDIQREPLLIAPVYAIPKALERARLAWQDIDLIEMHEAFAGQVLATLKAIESKSFAEKKLGLSSAIGNVDMSKLNLNGGSIALGHPFGATGIRLLLQALYQLKASDKTFGLITICAAGGLGMAIVVESI